MTDEEYEHGKRWNGCQHKAQHLRQHRQPTANGITSPSELQRVAQAADPNYSGRPDMNLPDRDQRQQQQRGQQQFARPRWLAQTEKQNPRDQRPREIIRKHPCRCTDNIDRARQWQNKEQRDTQPNASRQPRRDRADKDATDRHARKAKRFDRRSAESSYAGKKQVISRRRRRQRIREIEVWKLLSERADEARVVRGRVVCSSAVVVARRDQETSRHRDEQRRQNAGEQ